jgi:hypothetical protein
MKMKFTKIMIAAAACLALTAGKTMAQSGRLSIGFEAAQPLGDFGDGASTGFGGSLRYEHPMGEKLGLTFTAGWITFGGKEQEFAGIKYDGPGISLIPIQAGLKFYFKEQQAGLYIMGEIGAHAVTIGGVDFTDPITGAVTEGESSSNTSFSYAPAIGFHMKKIDIGLRYQFFSQETEEVTYDPTTGFPTGTESSSATEGYVGLRIAFVFGGGD